MRDEMDMQDCDFIAHVRKDGERQSLPNHLQGVAKRSGGSAEKVGLSLAGEILGLLHDLGKYSEKFQTYLKSATGIYDQDADEEYVDAKSLKGKIDHSTAGAKLIWRELSKQGPLGVWAGQIFALCIASHHSGLIDCISPAGDDVFGKRIRKPVDRTFLDEALANVDSDVLKRAEELLQNSELVRHVQSRLARIVTAPSSNGRDVIQQQQIGLLVRFLFRC